MPGLNTGDIIQIVYEGSIVGQQTRNILHYLVTSPSAGGDYATEMGKFLDDFAVGAVSPTLALLSACAQNWTLDRIIGQVITPTRQVYVPKVIALPGTIGNDCTALNVSGVITKRTDLAGRRYVGSFHAPGVPATGYVDGDITVGQKALYQTLGTRLLNIFTSATSSAVAQPILFHKPTPALSQDLKTVIVQDTLRTMRRRTVGQGI